MPFHVTEKTLAMLEWPAIVQRLARHARTPRARLQLRERGLPFAAEVGLARQRMGETSEARSLLEEGELPPLETVPEIDSHLARLRREGSLSGPELVAVARAARAATHTRRLLTRRREEAPTVAARAEALVDHAEWVAQVEGQLDEEGGVRDSASPALAAARRQARELAGSIQQQMEKLLRDPQIAPALQDSYATVRSDRFVLPVRADARRQVPGIVHDASASGTTLFIEPQVLVELNNRLKQAELEVVRETRRVLRQLSRTAASLAGEFDDNLSVLAQLDLAFARGALSAEMEATEPELDEAGRFVLLQLRHPLLPPGECVPNDLRLGEPFTTLVLSGPNAGGKTVALKALGLMALFARAGLHVPALPGARVALVERVLANIGDEQDLQANLSTFSAHVANLAGILRVADARSLVVLDEVGVGTDPGEGAALGQAVLEALADAGARVAVTTHFNLLKEMAEVDERFANACVEFDPETLAPTYRLRLGTPGASSATAVAARMGMPGRVIDRATALLEREDRSLDRLLAELGDSRASLERERREAARLREQSEAAREAYRARLERLQQRRDELFASMRADLESAFAAAHEEIAGVIRELQRGGRAQDAARARQRLLELEQEARRAEETQRHRTPRPQAPALDWRRIQPGTRVSVPGGGLGTLVSLPDRRGRACVQVGSGRLQIPADRLAPAPPEEGPPPRPPARGADPVGGTAHVDLRGLHVEEALAELERALDAALGRGAEVLEIVHGVGTGALQQAVRRQLKQLPFVLRYEAGAPEEGGLGRTLAWLAG